MSERNHLIDLARIVSVVVVVVFHTLLWVVAVEDGSMRISPWAPGPVWWALSWLFTIVPVFFVAAGYANAVVVDKWRATGTPYASFLITRGSRLLGPMTLFMIMFTAVGSVAAWTGQPAEAAALSQRFAQLLWFAVVYQFLLAAAPLAVWLHDRFGVLVMVPLLLAAVAVDAVVRVTGDPGWQWLNLAFIWPLAHQWGIAYHRGWFRGWRTRYLVAGLAGCALAIAALVFAGGYPPAAVAWADVLVANLLPPTIPILVLGLAQTLVLALLERRGVAADLRPASQQVIRLANALLLTVYLWQVPAILLGAGALVGLSLLWPAAVPVLMSRLLLVAVVLALLAAGVPWLARLELKLIPKVGPGDPSPWAAEVGYGLFCAGTFLVWQCGALLYPPAVWPTAAVALFALGVVA
ncbi:MAG: acyltransferase family protein, partial [Propionicimonas sp.]